MNDISSRGAFCAPRTAAARFAPLLLVSASVLGATGVLKADPARLAVRPARHAALEQSPQASDPLAPGRGRDPRHTLVQSDGPAPLMLPVLNFLGEADACRSWVAIQNVGAQPTKTVLVVWGVAGPACSGPLKAECSGLMAPGASWHYLGPQVPTGSSSGLVYSFDARPLSALGVTDLEDLAADYMCERLFFGTVGDCQGFRDFHEAYLAGTMFEDEIDLSAVRGQPIVATVLRSCPGDDNPGVEVSSTYGALPLVPESSGPVSDDRFVAYAYPVDGIPAPTGPFMNVQSMSTEDNIVVVEVAELDDAAMTWGPCEQRTLYLGEAAHVDLQGCLGLGTWYAVRAVGTGPLAATLDRIADDTMASWEGVGAGRPVDASGQPATDGLDAAVGPVVPLGAGWDGHLAVHVPGTQEIPVGVVWTLAGGRSYEEVRSICGGCVAEYVPPQAAQSDRAWLNVTARSGPPAARIDAALVTVRSTDVLEEAFGYALGRASSPESQVGGRPHAVPLFAADLDGVGITTELTLVHLQGAGEAASFVVTNILKGDADDVACSSIEPGRMATMGVAPSPVYTGTLGGGLVQVSTASGGELAAAVGVRTVTLTTPDLPIPGDETGLTLAPVLTDAPPGASPCAGYEPPLRPDPVADGGRAAAIRSAIRLPVLNYVGQDDVCQDQIEITNRGTEPGIGILVTWGEAGFCAPQCAGPLAVSCSGLIAPEGSWTVPVASSQGAAAAVVYGARAITLDEAGAEPGGSELAAEQLCSTLLYEAIGDCDDTRRFQLEWAAGGSFGGLPLAQLAYAEFSVVVHRSCPIVRPDQADEFDYAGIVADRFDPFADKEGRFVQSVVPAAVDGPASTVLYIQNGGARCTSVVLTYHLYGDWDNRLRCNVFTIAAGETYPFSLGDCVADWAGAVVLESEEPLAVVAEMVVGGSPRVAYGRNRSNPYDLDGDGVVDAADVNVLNEALASSPSDPNWNGLADLNADAVVDATDLRILVDNLEESAVATATPTQPVDVTATPTRPASAGIVFLPFAMWVPSR